MKLLSRIFKALFGCKKAEPLLSVIETEDELWTLLEKDGFNKTDRADDLSLRARSYVCSFVSYHSKDPFGAVYGEAGWKFVKRRYVFQHAKWGLWWLQCCQVGICLFVVLSRLSFYKLYATIVAVLYLGTKCIQGAPMIYYSAFVVSHRLTDQFLEYFSFLRVLRILVKLGFIAMGIGLGTGAAISDTLPSLSIHGLLNLATNGFIAFCGIVNGIVSDSAFTAVTSFVAFRFIGDFDDTFVEHMAVDATVEEMVADLKPVNSQFHYVFLICGFIFSISFTATLCLYPFIIGETGVIPMNFL
jgi:hypothetical protein